MANTPSINPTQESARNTQLGAVFDNVLFSTCDALEQAQIPYALIGGVAAGGLARPRSTHDIDIFVRPEDAEYTLQALTKAGFRTEKFDIQWLFKAFMDDILVDIIFRSEGEFYFDEEVQAHRRFVDYHGRKIPVVAPEDLAIIKCAVHYEGGPHHWHDALNLLSRHDIDWEYLVRRARRASRRVLSLLIYAQSNDLMIPNHAILTLFESVFGNTARKPGPALAPSMIPAGATFNGQVAAPRLVNAAGSAVRPHDASAAPEYVVAHVREALAEDPRTAQQDLKVLLSGNQLVVKGSCTSRERCAAIEEVIRAAAPGFEIVNQVQVVANEAAPERVEDIS